MAHILTLALPEESGALQSQLSETLQHSSIGNNLIVSTPGSHLIQIHHIEPAEPRAIGDIAAIIAECIAEYIVSHLERPALLRLMSKHYRDYDHNETDEILAYCQVLLKGQLDELPPGHPDPVLKRISDIARETRMHIETNSYIDIDGFLRFRLGDYRLELKDTLDYAVDEYLSNKQYQEFIGLLKYFVFFQDAKIPEVHLIHYGGNKYEIVDHLMRPVALSQADEVVVETIDRELNYEDMVVSTLISASPEYVYIHTREPDTLSIKTIRQIFESRTSLCTGCDLCRAKLDGLTLLRTVSIMGNKTSK